MKFILLVVFKYLKLFIFRNMSYFNVQSKMVKLNYFLWIEVIISSYIYLKKTFLLCIFSLLTFILNNMFWFLFFSFVKN